MEQPAQPSPQPAYSLVLKGYMTYGESNISGHYVINHSLVDAFMELLLLDNKEKQGGK